MLKLYYTGGGSATTGLGGAISSAEVSSTLGLLLPKLEEREAIDGITQYCCICLKNVGTGVLPNAGVFIASSTTDTQIYLAKGLTGKNSYAEQTIANNTTKPVGNFLFMQPMFDYDVLRVGELVPGDFYHIWIKRVTPPNTPGSQLDKIILEGVER